MSTELASGHISLSVKYGDAMAKLNRDIMGVADTARKSGDKAGKSLTTALVNGSRDAGTKASTNLQEQLGSAIGERIGLKLGRAIASPISRIMGTAGTDAGRKFSNNFEAEASRSSNKAGVSSGGGFVAGLAGFLKGPALGVIGLASAGIGVAISKGVGRLTAIDDAKAKLTGLGHDASSVQKIMDSAMASVKGTAFGMDEAATAAATAVAAGIKPGQQLTEYLSRIGDTAAIANTSLSEMAPIFNRIQTNGKAMTDDLQQLADRGIPVFTWLQDEYGVTGEALADMVSSGEVDAATFQKVIAKNIGGAAQKMGNNTSGALKNLNAAVSRFGAALVGPVFEKAAGFFTFLTGAVDKATSAVGPLLDKLGAAFGAFIDQHVAPAVQAAMPKIKEFFAGFQQYLPQISGAVSNVGGILQSALPKVLEVLKSVGGTVLGVLQNVAQAVQPLVSRLIGVVQSVYRGMAELLAKIAPKLAPLGQAIVKIFTAIMPAVRIAGQVIGSVLGVVANVIVAVAKAVLPVVLDVVTWILDKIGGLVGWLTGTAFPAIGGFFKGIGTVAMWLWNNAIVPAFNGIKTAIQVAWTVIQAALVPFQLGFKALGAVAQWLWTNIIGPTWRNIQTAIGMAWTVIEPIWEAFKAGVTAVGHVMQSLWNEYVVPVWDGIKSAFSAGWEFVSDIFTKLKDGFKAAADFIGNVWNGVAGVIKSAFDKILGALRGPIHALGDLLAGLPASIGGVEIPGAAAAQSLGQRLQGFRRGGEIRGPGTGTSDSILALVSNGEGIVTAQAMANGGAALVAALNAGWVPPVDMVRSMVGHIPGFAEGLNPGADFLRSQVMRMWPQITSIGGRRSEDGYGEHSSGNALDIMIPGWDTPQGKALGDAVASFVAQNASALGLDGFIWRQTSYGYGGSFSSGKPMGDRGSPTANHMDHVHVILGKGRGAGAPSVDAPTTSLSMPSGGSVSPGSGRRGGVSARRMQDAQDRVTDLENRVEQSQMALDEAEANPKTKESARKSKRDALEKNKRELEQAKQELADLQAQGQTDSGGGDSNNPYTKIMEGIKEIIGDAPGQLAQIGMEGLKETFLPPGFSDPQQWGLVQAGSSIMKWIGGLVGGIPGMEAVGSILGGVGSAVGGDASGAVNAFTSLLPQPFGDAQIGTPDMQPEDFAASQHLGSGGLPGPGDLSSAYTPDPEGGQTQTVNNDNSIHVAEGGSIGVDPVKVQDKTQRQQAANQRPHLGTRRFI